MKGESCLPYSRLGRAGVTSSGEETSPEVERAVRGDDGGYGDRSRFGGREKEGVVVVRVGERVLGAREEEGVDSGGPMALDGTGMEARLFRGVLGSGAGMMKLDVSFD